MDEEKKNIKEIYVAKVINSMDVVINKGRDDGIKSSDKFFIHRFEELIKDPVSGENLERLEHIVGTARVKHLQDKITIITSDRQKRNNFLFILQKNGNEDIYEPFDSPHIGDEVLLKRRDDESTSKNAITNTNNL